MQLDIAHAGGWGGTGKFRSYVDAMIRVNFMSPIDTEPIGKIRELKQAILRTLFDLQR